MKKREIKTKCAKKFRTPKTMLSWYDSEDHIAYHYLVALNRNYCANYRVLASYHVDMHVPHPVATAIGALDDLTHQIKDKCLFS